MSMKILQEYLKTVEGARMRETAPRRFATHDSECRLVVEINAGVYAKYMAEGHTFDVAAAKILNELEGEIDPNHPAWAVLREKCSEWGFGPNGDSTRIHGVTNFGEAFVACGASAKVLLDAVVRHVKELSRPGRVPQSLIDKLVKHCRAWDVQQLTENAWIARWTDASGREYLLPNFSWDILLQEIDKHPSLNAPAAPHPVFEKLKKHTVRHTFTRVIDGWKVSWTDNTHRMFEMTSALGKTESQFLDELSKHWSLNPAPPFTPPFGFTFNGNAPFPVFMSPSPTPREGSVEHIAQLRASVANNAAERDKALEALRISEAKVTGITVDRNSWRDQANAAKAGIEKMRMEIAWRDNEIASVRRDRSEMTEAKNAVVLKLKEALLENTRMGLEREAHGATQKLLDEATLARGKLTVMLAERLLAHNSPKTALGILLGTFEGDAWMSINVPLLTLNNRIGSAINCLRSGDECGPMADRYLRGDLDNSFTK